MIDCVMINLYYLYIIFLSAFFFLLIFGGLQISSTKNVVVFPNLNWFTIFTKNMNEKVFLANALSSFIISVKNIIDVVRGYFLC